MVRRRQCVHVREVSRWGIGPQSSVPASLPPAPSSSDCGLSATTPVQIVLKTAEVRQALSMMEELSWDGTMFDPFKRPCDFAACKANPEEHAACAFCFDSEPK